MQKLKPRCTPQMFSLEALGREHCTTSVSRVMSARRLPCISALLLHAFTCCVATCRQSRKPTRQGQTTMWAHGSATLPAARHRHNRWLQTRFDLASQP